MKTQVIYTASESNLFCNLRSAFTTSKPMQEIAAVFSILMEEEVSPMRALRLLHAHAAFATLVLFGAASPIVAVLLLVWFGAAAWQCKSNN